MAVNEESHLSNDDQEKADEELKRSLKVHFHLEGAAFPDNKIFGTIDIEPKSAGDLIKEFTFILNGSREVKFYPQYRTISVSGFNPRQKNFSAVIKAKFATDKWTKNVYSERCSFYFLGNVFALSPTVSFDWPDGKNDTKVKPTLVVQWRHIGDEKAHEYVLYLNDKKIYHIRHQLINNDIKIRIQNVICDIKHTLQIAAKLINGKETFRSDPIEFMMPTKKLENHETEVLTILNEPKPNSLPVVIAPNQDEATKEKDDNEIKQPSSGKQTDQFRLEIEYLLSTLKLQIETRTNHSRTACCPHLPHETFLGIEHYLDDGVNTINKPSSSNLRINATYSRRTLKRTLIISSAKDKQSDNYDKKIRTMNIKKEETDDDDDVVVGTTSDTHTNT